MKLIDTHCHIFLEEFKEDREEVLKRAIETGIACLLLPNVDAGTISSLHSVWEKYPDYTYPMMGLHPTGIDKDYKKELAKIEYELTKHMYCAIGEIGIDLYWDKTYLKEQQEAFEKQLQWSIDLNLPVSIHTREAFNEVFESIYKVGADKIKGVFHSFTGSVKELETIRKLENFMIGVNGVVTFKNSNLRDVLQGIETKRLVVETDAPYLAPVPYRGKRNEPAYIWKTVETLSKIYHVTVDEMADILTENTLKMFSIVKLSA